MFTQFSNASMYYKKIKNTILTFISYLNPYYEIYDNL